MNLLLYKASDADSSEKFFLAVCDMVSISPDHPKAREIYGRAWYHGSEGGTEEVIYMFWDLVEMEGL